MSVVTTSASTTFVGRQNHVVRASSQGSSASRLARPSACTPAKQPNPSVRIVSAGSSSSMTTMASTPQATPGSSMLFGSVAAGGRSPTAAQYPCALSEYPGLLPAAQRSASPIQVHGGLPHRAQSPEASRRAVSPDVYRRAQSPDLCRRAQSPDVSRRAQSPEVCRTAQPAVACTPRVGAEMGVRRMRSSKGYPQPSSPFTGHRSLPFAAPAPTPASAHRPLQQAAGECARPQQKTGSEPSKLPQRTSTDPSKALPKPVQDASGAAAKTPATHARASLGHIKTPVLSQFGRDLTKSAASGDLDPLIGREAETEQVIQALVRRRKNNPVLIGDSGVGKSAIVEGLAQKIVKGDVPQALQDKRIVQLDVGSLVAGTKNRGEFEERIKKIIDEVMRAKQQIVLFIDELHTLVGTGRSQNGGNTIDAASLLKPALARGDLQCVGVTTIEEYRLIEKDSSLERRFQPITVNEASVEETVRILKGLSRKFEAHHKLRYSDAALLACVKLAAQHIPDRCMPDKAIDVFDEVGANVQLRCQALGSVGTRVPDLARAAVAKLQAVQAKKEEAVRCEQYSWAAQLKLREMNLNREISQILSNDVQRSSTEPSQREEYDGEVGIGVVTEDDVAHVVATKTGIPVEKLSADESGRMMRLEETLHQHIIGQDHAVRAVSKALRRARVGLQNPSRPIASFLFCGPTGVGKTELCKVLSTAYFGRDDSMIRLDMSEFMERHSTSKLIGSPPGYAGYGEQNQLSDRIRRKPYSLVLLDEIEKANADVLNLMLQILEDGRLTDSMGRVVSFRNALIIMTSNAGTSPQELNQFFPPEFLNRLDEIIAFRSLTKTEVGEIAELEFAKTARRVSDKGVRLTIGEAFKARVIEEGFDSVFGARPLRRAVVKLLDDELSVSFLRRPPAPGEHVHVDLDEDGCVVALRQQEADSEAELASSLGREDREEASTMAESASRSGLSDLAGNVPGTADSYVCLPKAEGEPIVEAVEVVTLEMDGQF